MYCNKNYFEQIFFFYFLLSICLFQETQVRAEEPPTIVITPSRIEQDIKQVGSSVVVVTKDEIEKKKLQNLADVLRTVEGLQVIRSGGPGSLTSISLRGSSASQVLVMLDSVPINEVNSGQFDFADLSILAIERVEILKGPQSVAYGSAALGGVINIITKGAEDGDSGNFIIEAGSYGTQRYLGEGRFRQEISEGKELAGNIGYSFFDTHNISQANEKNGNVENDPYKNQSLNSNLAYKIDGETDLLAAFRYSNGRAELDGFDFIEGATDALDYKQKRETYQSSFQAKTKIDFWSPKLILGYNQENYLASDPVTDFNNYQLKSNTTSVQQQNLFELNSYLSTLMGYSYQQNDGVNVGSLDKSRYVNSVFIENFISPYDSLNLSLGGRHDDDSTFGSEYTYRASVAQMINPLDSKLHASYGTGFRAPTFSDLFFPNFSNPNLDPEKSRGFDIGLSSSYGILNSDISYFYTRYDDLIAFSNVNFLPENIEEARTQGVESKFNFEVYDQTTVALGYTYLDARNLTNNQLLPRRARHQSSVSLSNQTIEKLLLRSDVLFLADRVEADGSNMDDYVIVSALVQYALTKNLSPYVRVQNAFDRNYEEIEGYGTLGASIFAGLQYRI